MRLLTEKEVAQMLAVSPVMLRKQRCVGADAGGAPVVPWVKMGTRVRYLEADVIEYIESLRPHSAA